MAIAELDTQYRERLEDSRIWTPMDAVNLEWFCNETAVNSTSLPKPNAVAHAFLLFGAFGCQPWVVSPEAEPCEHNKLELGRHGAVAAEIEDWHEEHHLLTERASGSALTTRVWPTFIWRYRSRIEVLPASGPYFQTEDEELQAAEYGALATETKPGNSMYDHEVFVFDKPYRNPTAVIRLGRITLR